MTNRLTSCRSAYLRQHSNNPIWWQPWGQEAFDEARERDVPIFLSIGYASCYWCHVMEEDSFARDEVAAVLNHSFVSIKVDREERPDVDETYMDAVVGLQGHGGWPLTVFLTPSLEPFWGTTFMRRAQFIQVLQYLNDLWHNDRGRITSAASGIKTDILGPMHAVPAGVGGTSSVAADHELFTEATERLTSSYDPTRGGFGSAPKFPPHAAIPFLFREGARQRNDSLTTMALHTLEMMARGGIHDLIGGGFHRYSVDAHWGIPHFEKMLYDNGLLASRYLDAYAITGRDSFRWVAQRTLDWMERELLVADSGFAASFDAGGVGEEGHFYSWTRDELTAVWSSDAERCFATLDCPAIGNFEGGRSVLSVPQHVGFDELIALTPLLERAYTARAERAAPARDDKILLGWNSLAIAAFARAGTLISPRYLDRAISVARYLLDALSTPDARLRCGSLDNDPVPALLEDYTYFIEALLALFVATTDEEWLSYAQNLQAEQDRLFWSESLSRYRHSSAPELIIATASATDGATPSPNGVALANLGRLARYAGAGAYGERWERLASSLRSDALRFPHGTASVLGGLWDYWHGAEVVIADPAGAMTKFSSGEAPFSLPGISLFHIHSSNDTAHSRASLLQDKVALNKRSTFYVCTNGRCLAPCHDMNSLVRELSRAQRLTSLD